MNIHWNESDVYLITDKDKHDYTYFYINYTEYKEGYMTGRR